MYLPQPYSPEVPVGTAALSAVLSTRGHFVDANTGTDPQLYFGRATSGSYQLPLYANCAGRLDGKPIELGLVDTVAASAATSGDGVATQLPPMDVDELCESQASRLPPAIVIMMVHLHKMNEMVIEMRKDN
jgi:hypothetical protein